MGMKSSTSALNLAYACTLSFSCVQMILYTTIPYIAEHTQVATSSIIGAISVGSLFFALFGPFWAARSDTLGRKKILAVGMTGMTLSFSAISLVFIFNETLPLWAKTSLIVMARVIYGALASAVVPVSQAWQLDLKPGFDRIKVMTKNSMCLNIGRILGPVLVLTKQVNFEYMIYAASIWLALLLTALTIIAPSTEVTNLQFDESKKNIKQQWFEWKSLAMLALAPTLLSLIFTSFTGIMHSFLGHHLKITLSLGGDQASVLMAKMVLGLSFIAVLVQQVSILRKSTAWQKRLLIGALSLVTGSFIMAKAHSEADMWASIVLIAIAVALIPPVYLSLLGSNKEDGKKSNQGKKIGLASVSHSLGYALGAGLISISMKLNVVSEMAVVCFVSAAILSLVAFMLLSQKKEENQKVSCC